MFTKHHFCNHQPCDNRCRKAGLQKKIFSKKSWKNFGSFKNCRTFAPLFAKREA